MKHEIVYFSADGKAIASEVIAENGWKISDNTAWNESLKLGFSWQIKDFDGMEEVRILRNSLREDGTCKFKNIIPDVGRISGHEGDGSSLVIPQEHGYLSHCEGKDEHEFLFPIFNRWPSQCNMSLFGIVRNGGAVAAVIEDGRFDAEFRIRFNFGATHLYAMNVVFCLRDYFDEAITREDCVIRYKTVSGSWPQIGRFYREYVLKHRRIKTLSDKMESNPVLQYATQAITVRFRMGVKKLPTPLPHQTPENEPPMTVFLTFDMVGEIAKELYAQKVGPAELCLVGWNYGAHDGAWPKIFPVEPRIGGEASMVKNILEIDKLGFPVSLHEAYTGAFELAAEFGEYDMEDVTLDHDGHRKMGGLLGGGQIFRCCPSTIFKYAERNFRRASKLPIKGSYYCDVSSIMELNKCYSPTHPLDRKGAAECWERLAQMQHEFFGSSMSEGSREWAFPGLDRAYLVGWTMDDKRPNLGLDKELGDFDVFDEEIPLFEIVYHGSFIYNAFRDGVNSVRGEKIYLRSFAYGGTPLYYYHYVFNPDWTNTGMGWDNDLLRYTTPENIKKGVRYIKEASDDNARVASLQMAFMDDFIKHSDTLTQTVYSNGKSVWVNYGETEVKTPEGKTIPAKDFIVA